MFHERALSVPGPGTRNRVRNIAMTARVVKRCSMKGCRKTASKIGPPDNQKDWPSKIDHYKWLILLPNERMDVGMRASSAENC